MNTNRHVTLNRRPIIPVRSPLNQPNNPKNRSSSNIPIKQQQRHANIIVTTSLVTTSLVTTPHSNNRNNHSARSTPKTQTCRSTLTKRKSHTHRHRSKHSTSSVIKSNAPRHPTRTTQTRSHVHSRRSHASPPTNMSHNSRIEAQQRRRNRTLPQSSTHVNRPLHRITRPFNRPPPQRLSATTRVSSHSIIILQPALRNIRRKTHPAATQQHQNGDTSLNTRKTHILQTHSPTHSISPHSSIISHTQHVLNRRIANTLMSISIHIQRTLRRVSRMPVKRRQIITAPNGRRKSLRQTSPLNSHIRHQNKKIIQLRQSINSRITSH